MWYYFLLSLWTCYRSQWVTKYPQSWNLCSPTVLSEICWCMTFSHSCYNLKTLGLVNEKNLVLGLTQENSRNCLLFPSNTWNVMNRCNSLRMAVVWIWYGCNLLSIKWPYVYLKVNMYYIYHIISFLSKYFTFFPCDCDLHDT